jgi:hypothetical protein
VEDFEFYGDANDCVAAAAAVLADSSYFFLPNVCYERPAAIEIRSVGTDFEKYLLVNRVMFIAGPFTQNLSWERLATGRWTGHYVIRPEYDGPLISVRFPPVSNRGGTDVFRAGMIHLRPRAYVPALDVEVPASSQAKAAFRDIVARVRLVCRKIAVDAEKVWVGRALLDRASTHDSPHVVINGREVPLRQT